MSTPSALVCTTCQTPLEDKETYFACKSCEARYAGWFGIVSLIARSETDLDPSTQRLLAAFPKSSFEVLLEMRAPSFSTGDPELVQRYRAYRQNMMQRGKAFYEMARSIVETPQGDVGKHCAIALGCGAGASMVCMARDFDHVIGVDPDLADLLLARKTCDELGIANVTLAHCFGERMPVKSGDADLVVAENVLEHVPELRSVLKEVSRTLKPGASFVGDCANRFNILRPEPHVHLWGVGLLPRKWQAPYVKWRRNFEGYDRAVHLKSYRQLRSELRKQLGDHSRVAFPKAVAFGFSKRIDDALDVINRVPLLRLMLLAIFPVFVAVGVRSRT